MKRLLTPLALALIATGCTTVGPDYQRPAITLPAQYPGAVNGTQATSAVLIAADWWTLYGDAELTRSFPGSCARVKRLWSVAGSVSATPLSDCSSGERRALSPTCGHSKSGVALTLATALQGAPRFTFPQLDCAASRIPAAPESYFASSGMMVSA